jgi:hypothetical protein
MSTKKVFAVLPITEEKSLVVGIHGVPESDEEDLKNYLRNKLGDDPRFNFVPAESRVG